MVGVTAEGAIPAAVLDDVNMRVAQKDISGPMSA
jgi:hypothetical protein